VIVTSPRRGPKHYLPFPSRNGAADLSPKPAVYLSMPTSLGAVRYVLGMHPAPELQRSQTFRPAPAFSGLAQTLTAAELTAMWSRSRRSDRLPPATESNELEAAVPDGWDVG
jgi:hypothetical protein